MSESAPTGCPVHSPGAAPTLAGEGATDYERYMHVPDLLRLQKPGEELVHHDELMFITVHQTFELWCNLVMHELRAVREHIEADRVLHALPLLRRATDTIRINSEAMHVLETMTPMDFHVIRAALGQGSGAESPGFRNILAYGPVMWPAVDALMERRGIDLKEAYLERKDQELVLLLEALTDFDMFFHLWRLNHLAMIKRVIGRDVKSLKGYAVHQLEDDVQHVLWPALWKVRNDLTMVAGTSPP